MPTTTSVVAEVVLASNEACANAMEHAYRSGAGQIEVTARCDDGHVTVNVADRGVWRATPAPRDRGRGMAIMEP